MANAFHAADLELYKKIHFEEGEFWSSGMSCDGHLVGHVMVI
jgi:hypothetical protein